MDIPVVSILTPVYNAYAYLPKYFETVLGQTYQNIRVILIDDGSNDDSWRIMLEYAVKDSRVEIYRQENCGVSPTRNSLLKKVKGDYILYVDPDDWIELDMVENLVKLALDYNSGLVMCDRVINNTPVSKKESKVNLLTREKAIEDFLCHDYFIGSLGNKLISIQLLYDLKFNDEIWYGEDALFCWAVLQRVDKVVVTSKQLYHYREVEQSISHQPFGERKLTGFVTWNILKEETKNKWPQFADIALASFVRNGVSLLQVASQEGYPRNRAIKRIQRSARKNYKALLPMAWSNPKRWLFSTIIIWWYNYGKLYYRLHKCLNIIK